MALRPTLKLMLVALAALLVAGTTVVLAAGSSAKPAGVRKAAARTRAAAPKTMHVACARDGGGKLEYRPDGSTDCGGKLLHFPKDGPVTACQLDQDNSQIYEARLAPPAHKHAVKGMLFVVSDAGKCKAPHYPHSHARRLPPRAHDLSLCAGKRRGAVRVVTSFADCSALEFPVVLKKRNRRPTAADQSVTVQEDTAKPIVLAGSDPDGDALAFHVQSGPSHGTLTGTAPHVTYHPAANYTGHDSFTFKVSDGRGGSDTGTVSITVTPQDDAPQLATTSGSTAYTENDSGVAADPGLTVSDTDDTSLQGATVTISTGFRAGDLLDFTDQNGISGSYDSGTGALTLTGAASVADYQAALRSVEFSSSDDNPPSSKTVDFKANDGTDDSNTASKDISVTAVNDPPTDVPDSGPTQTYTEGDAPKALFGDLVVADPDSSHLVGASIAFTQNYHSGEDQLAFTDTPKISGNWNPSTGVLSLTGTATPAEYQAAIRSITYEDTSANPATDTRRIDGIVDDGAASNHLSDGFDREVSVTATNTKPSIATSAGATSNTEGSADPVDPSLTVSDPDSANLAGATVRISSGFQPGDDLQFVDTANISGSYDTGTGVLTLSGTDTVANYQAALRSIKFDTTNDNPSSSKIVGFVASDGDKSSDEAFKSLSITGVNDAPILSTSSGSAAFTENGPAVAVDPNVSVDDPDSTNLSGAKVSISSNFSSADGDTLGFTDTPNITGSYNSSTGVLTLSGTDTLADYQAALRSVTFSNTSDNPSTATRTVSFQVSDDGALPSNTDTRDVTVAAADDAPTVTTSSGSTSYTEGDPATTIDGSLTVADPDDTNLEGATVRISSGFQSGDDLVFVDTANISGLYDTGTGVLTLSGTDTVANYQAALRSIKFDTTNDNPSGSKTVGFVASDGDKSSDEAFKSLSITGVNDAPSVSTSSGSAAFTENGQAVPVDPNVSVDDPDSTNLSGAKVSISSNFSSADGDALNFIDTANITGSYDSSTGVLTLSGTDTVANYQAALQSVTFSNTSDNPSTATRTVGFQVTDDGAADSNTATRDVTVAAADDSPVVDTSTGSTSYSEGDPATPVDASLTVSDPDDTNLKGATVRISSNFQSGDDLVFVNTATISGVYNTGTGVLTLSGTDTVANYQAALRSIKFGTTNDNPSGSKTIGFTAKDPSDAESSEAFKGIDITGVNDAPTVNTTGTNLAYTEGDGPKAADDGITVDDPDSTNLSGAKVSITSNFSSADDTLAFTDTAKITGTYDSSTGVLTLSGSDTVANYQAALRSVTYEDTSDNPSGTKTLSFQATDDKSADSNTATRDVDLTGVNDPPVVGTTAGDTAYTEGDPATPVDDGVTVDDPDNADLTGGTVKISSGLQTGDELKFTDTATISGSYDSGTGVLTLSGTDTVANYQAALRSVEFVTSNEDPTTSKTVEFKVSDGTDESSPATKGLAITPVNTAPTVTTTATDLSYTEGDGPKAADDGITVSDPDSTNLSQAKVSISSGFSSTDDTLAFTDTANITGSYNSSTGVLTLSGTDTVANYQAALRSVTYEDSSQDPSGSKTLSFQVTDDGALPSNTATRDVDLTAVNDAPVVATSSGNTAYTEGDPPTTVDDSVTVSDVDNADLTGGTVKISSGFQTGDQLVFVAQNGISGLYDPGTGVLTLSGTSSVANYQTALQSIQYTSTNVNPNTSKTVSFQVTDGTDDSNAATKGIDVTPVNSPPIVDATNTALSYTENDPAAPVDSGLTITEPEGDSLSGGSAEITSNYQSTEDALTWTDNDMSDLITKDLINSTNSKVVLMGVGTDAQYQAALRAVKYVNGSENPSSLTRTVTFSAKDALGATGSDTRDITVTPVDDPPVAVNDSANFTEDDPATAIPVLSNDTDVDGGPKTIASVTQPANGTVATTGGSPGAATGLTYKPNANYCNNPPDTSPDTFTYTLNGGSTATVSVHVLCVNDAPVANDDTFSGAVGNTTFVGNDPTDGAPATPDPTDTSPATDRPHNTISADIMANDTDVDSPSSQFTVTPGTFTTHDGGTVTIQSDGDFTFEPKASTSCTDHQDSFDYTLNDNDPSDPKTDTGTVTINITDCAWYVNNDDLQGDAGTSEKPYNSLGEAETASGSGDSIFVYKGNSSTASPYTGGIALDQNEQLIGEDSDFVVGGTTLHSANSTKRPTLTKDGGDVVTLASGDTVRGLAIDPLNAGGGVSGGSGVAGGTLDNLNIVDTGTGGTQPGLELNGTSGTFNVSNLTVDNSGSTGNTSGSEGVLLNNAGTVNFNPTGTISLTTKGAKALDASGTGLGTSTFDDITTTGSGSGAVSLSSTTGTTNLGDGVGTDLDLSTTSGSTAALSLVNAGSVTVPSAGTANVSATGGPAVSAQGSSTTPVTSLAMDSVSSTNSASDGIFLNIGTGTFSASGGSLSAAGSDVNIGGGSGNITYDGTLGDGTGNTANIVGRTQGAISLTGNITDSSDVNGGISASGNSGGSVTFSGGTKTINTGTADAVNVTVPDSSTFSTVFSNGGADITTTSGKGLSASGAGSVPDGNIQVSGTGNKISTGTGRALDLGSINISGAGVTFEKISASGATNAIKLDTTGTNAGLTVTGGGSTSTGGDASGGTVANDTSDAIKLNNTTSPSFTNLNVSSPNHAGVRGTNVHGFKYDNGTITNAGNSHTSSTDGAFAFNTSTGVTPTDDNVDGTLEIKKDSIQTPYGGAVDVLNYAGTLSSIDVSNNTTTSSTDPTLSKEDAISFGELGSTTTSGKITAGHIDNNTINNFPSGYGVTVGSGNAASSSAPITQTGVPSGSQPGTGSLITISNNTMTGDPTTKIQNGILLGPTGRGDSNFTVANNTVSKFAGEGIAAGGGGSGTNNALITGNTFNAANIANNPGISIGVGKATLADSSVSDGGTSNIDLGGSGAVNGTGNTTTGTQGQGLLARAQDSNATLNLRVANNNFGNPTGNFKAGIRVDSGGAGSASFNPTLCLDIHDNTSGSNGTVFGTKLPGIEMSKASDLSTTYKYGIVGLSPSPTTPTNAQNYVGTRNPNSVNGIDGDPSSPPDYSGKAVADAGDNFTSCTLPFS